MKTEQIKIKESEKEIKLSILLSAENYKRCNNPRKDIIFRIVQDDNP